MWFVELFVEQSRRLLLLLTLGKFFFRYQIICCKIYGCGYSCKQCLVKTCFET